MISDLTNLFTIESERAYDVLILDQCIQADTPTFSNSMIESIQLFLDSGGAIVVSGTLFVDWASLWRADSEPYWVQGPTNDELLSALFPEINLDRTYTIVEEEGKERYLAANSPIGLVTEAAPTTIDTIHTSGVMLYSTYPYNSHGFMKVSFAQKWAVIIGIKDYKGKDAYGAVNDANNMYTLLIDTLGFSKENVHLLTDDTKNSEDDVNGSRTAILQELVWLQNQALSNDIVVFYISSHGKRHESGEPEYIMPHSGDDISDDALKEEIDKITSLRIVVIMDLCYSGGFIYDNDQHADLSHGSPKDRIVLTACSESETAWTAIYHWLPPKLKCEGVFTHWFVNAFAINPITGKPFGDVNGDGKVSIEEAFNYALVSIFLYEHAKQHPQMYDGISGDLYIGN